MATSESNDHPFSNTEAALLLRGALRALAERPAKISLRELGRRLGYKQPVVLSHMASGRVPIPVERAMQLAAATGMNEASFVRAVLAQRYPDTPWNDLLNSHPQSGPDNGFVGTLAGISLDTLTAEQKRIANELVRDTHPDERWLSTAEVMPMKELRRVRPTIRKDGLSPAELDAVMQALQRDNAY